MKTLITLLYIVVAGLFLTSCSDWLDVQPETEQKEEDLFSAYKGFRSALTGCYMAMGNNDVYGERLTMSNIESLAGLWDIPYEPYDEARLVDYYLMQRDYNDVAREAIQTIYSKIFNVIVQANKVIVNAEANADAFPDEATRSVILGEAYALRAYCQLDVLRLFGEVPNGRGEKVSLPYSEITAFNERATRYDFAGYAEKLIADLAKAEELLKDNDPIFTYTFDELNEPEYMELEDTYMAYRRSRLNYWAVKALQARAYLYIGRTSEAYTAAKAIIDAKNEAGQSVMPLAGDDDRTSGYYACPNDCLFYLSKPDVKDVASILIGGATDIDSENYHLYTTTDRLDELFPVNKDSDSRYTAEWNRQVGGSGSGDAAIRKYYFTDDAENQTVYRRIVPMLRLAEVYLIAIETTTDLAEANSLYKDYMLYGCGVALNTDAFAANTDRSEVLVLDYCRDFFAEGQTFYAYKRIGASEMLWCDEVTDKDYVLWNCVNTEFNP